MIATLKHLLPYDALLNLHCRHLVAAFPFQRMPYQEIHRYSQRYDGNLRDAVAKACSQIVGTYGLAVVCSQEPGRIVVTRKDSPIVLAHGEKGSYVASDIIAVIEASRDITVLSDNEFAVMEPDGISYTDAEGNPVQPKIMHVDWDVDVAEKGGYPDFMLKEIHEQPRVIRDTLAGRLTNGVLSIDELGMSLEQLRLIDRVYIIACGTSYHAGLIARQLIEGWARIPVEVEAASEFRYRSPIITPSTLVVAVSQSGETADTLAAIRDAASKAPRSLASLTSLAVPWPASLTALSTLRLTRRLPLPQPNLSSARL